MTTMSETVESEKTVIGSTSGDPSIDFVSTGSATIDSGLTSDSSGLSDSSVNDSIDDSSAGGKSSDDSSDEGSRKEKNFVDSCVAWFNAVWKTVWQMLMLTYRMICLMYTYPTAARHATWITYKALMLSYRFELLSLMGVYNIVSPQKPPPPPKLKAIVIQPPEKASWLGRWSLLNPEKGLFGKKGSQWSTQGIFNYLTVGLTNPAADKDESSISKDSTSSMPMSQKSSRSKRSGASKSPNIKSRWSAPRTSNSIIAAESAESKMSSVQAAPYNMASSGLMDESGTTVKSTNAKVPKNKEAVRHEL